MKNFCIIVIIFVLTSCAHGPKKSFNELNPVQKAISITKVATLGAASYPLTGIGYSLDVGTLVLTTPSVLCTLTIAATVAALSGGHSGNINLEVCSHSKKPGYYPRIGENIWEGTTPWRNLSM